MVTDNSCRFEAAWSGDLKKIKLLTLTSWDVQGEEPPLKIAVRDTAGNNPFSLAFHRGHYDVAKTILEIVQLQYAPEEKPKTRYRMVNDDDDECDTDYDSEVDEENDDMEPRIQVEIVDQRVTIENVGQVSMKVKSKTKPLEVLDWICPEYRAGKQGYPVRSVLMSVVHNNDLKGLKFLLDLGEHHAAQKLETDDEPAHLFSFPDKAFESAVRHGRIELLTEIIRRTGAGLPLDQLVKSSGLELAQKPRYYQGLTVYGKKREDWADAQRGVAAKQSGGTSTSPLLTAALAGRIECLEWFLSDTPLRLYLEFGLSKAAAKDSRLLHLAQSPGGFEGAVSTWLNNQSDRIIHAAILARPCAQTNAMVAYLIKACPETIDAKSEQDVTPLVLAAKLGRTEIARMLLAAGADPCIRNSNRENLLHLALHHGPTAQQLDGLLSLFEPSVIQRLARERDSGYDGGKTPLHRWLVGYTTDQAPSVLALLLKRTGGAELDYLDGAGDTILHTLVRRTNYDLGIIRAIIEARPSLLYRENAVGRTPIEVARDGFITRKIRRNEFGNYQGGRGDGYNYVNRYWSYTSNEGDNPIANMVDRDPETFVKKTPADDTSSTTTGETSRSDTEKMWDLIRESAASHPDKRRLVSLHEANDVARRLGEQNAKQERYKFRVKEPKVSDEEKEKEKRRGNGADVVTLHWKSGDAPQTAWKDFDNEDEKNEDEEEEQVDKYQAPMRLGSRIG